jgi:hypothetical protein
LDFDVAIGLAFEPEERELVQHADRDGPPPEGAEGTGEALDGHVARERDRRGEHLRHHAAQQPAAREVVLDVGEGHPCGAGVLSHQRDDAALPLGEVPLVPAEECLEADDGAGNPGVLAGTSAGDDGDLAKRRAGGVRTPRTGTIAVEVGGESGSA